MLDRENLRPERLYWVQKRKSEDRPTVALLYGELPSLSIKVLDGTLYPSACNYDFLAEAEYSELWDATFKGTTISEVKETQMKAKASV